ncbi:unnamed protein product [Linum tenue]|uniref:AB hydrolase-1 domain-containing protein n=1 Tax=Linum tenue TaxID=586396 RepID=A0AAV0M780_9ROSI|nr:unnamed protein product [Linum tenue]
MVMMRRVAMVLSMVIFGWVYQITHPPPPKICGRPGGPPVTGPRIKLRDGRHLAYTEYGLPKDVAKFKLIFIHGFTSCRYDRVVTFPPEVYQELGVHIVSFDRPGYGESDPDPNRTPESLAMDVEELADQLGLGSKFYVLGFSMGGQAVWGCIKYIPHRLAGAGMIAPVVNYWWPGFPSNLSTEAYYFQLPQDQWTLRVAHYAPWLTYWWNTQNWFPASAVAAGRAEVFSSQDLEIIANEEISDEVTKLGQLRAYPMQQGNFESLHRDMMVGFGRWEFDPMDMEINPIPDGGGSVHLWHGEEDQMVPVTLQRYIAKKLPWVKYHELPGKGHMFPLIPEISQSMIKALLYDEN